MAMRREKREQATKRLLIIGDRASDDGYHLIAKAIYRLAAEVMLYGLGAWPFASNQLTGTGWYDCVKDVDATIAEDGERVT